MHWPKIKTQYVTVVWPMQLRTIATKTKYIEESEKACIGIEPMQDTWLVQLYWATTTGQPPALADHPNTKFQYEARI